MTNPFSDTELRHVLCDLDGVVWLARRPIPGAPEAIARFRDAGCRVLFVTNNSMSTIATQESALDQIGVPAVGDVVTSAQAAAQLVAAGERVLVCGGAGVREAVAAREALALDHRHEGVAEAVIVGLHHDFDYERMAAAARAIRDGARFIATNDDATYPTPDGPIPGAGALVAAVATASGSQPQIAGKPHRAIAEVVAERCGDEFTSDAAIVIGDRWSTDGAFATTLGCPFALVRSGVTAPGDDPGGPVDADLPDLATVARELLG